MFLAFPDHQLDLPDPELTYDSRESHLESSTYDSMQVIEEVWG
jgi:hypothetical protein